MGTTTLAASGTYAVSLDDSANQHLSLAPMAAEISRRPIAAVSMAGEPAAPTQVPAGGTDLLERTEVESQRCPGDNERYAHFVRKDRITSSVVTGQPVVALCGKVWVPLRDPRQFPVCPACKAILEAMGSQGSGWPFQGGSGSDDGTGGE